MSKFRVFLKFFFGFFIYLSRVFRFFLSGYSSDFKCYNLTTKNKIHVIGNGPSLEKTLKFITQDDDIMMVNFSPNNSRFYVLKPKYLCFADPILFESSNHQLTTKIEELYDNINNKIDWLCIIIVPYKYKKNALSLINNPNVKVQGLNQIYFENPLEMGMVRFYFYNKNLAAPIFQNVLNMSLYSSIQIGYSEILLHGADSDSYKNISINQNNEMILIEKHFYGTNVRNIAKEQFQNFSPGNLYKRLNCEVKMFESYLDLSKYAHFKGVRIINMSSDSMIDAFERYVDNQSDATVKLHERP